MINLSELKNVIDAAGFPVAYSHFVDSSNFPLPEPPFIVYLCTSSANFIADNLVHTKMDNVQIELYTNTKDLAAEKLVEAALNDAELPWASTETYIESEQLFQKIYEVRVLNNA
jgi:hypothetical protein